MPLRRARADLGAATIASTSHATTLPAATELPIGAFAWRTERADRMTGGRAL